MLKFHFKTEINFNILKNVWVSAITFCMPESSKRGLIVVYLTQGIRVIMQWF